MANKVNKLYITLHERIPTTVGSGFSRVLAFNVTQTTFATVAADEFGRFLQDRQPLPALIAADQRAVNKVSAWFSQGGFVIGGPSHIAAAALVSLDFIAATGNATVADSIDPILTRNFRVRAIINRLVALADFPQVTLHGTINVDRQHSIEV